MYKKYAIITPFKKYTLNVFIIVLLFLRTNFRNNISEFIFLISLRQKENKLFTNYLKASKKKPALIIFYVGKHVDHFIFRKRILV